MIKINGERLLADLHALRAFGACGTGVVRQALSAADIESREWLRDRYTAAGLQASIDGLGNVYGDNPDCDRAILIGSHSDTQKTGGWLDGAMGVIYGLELARAYRESGHDGAIGIDAVSWNDEEGTFGHSLGSRSFCNILDADEIADAHNEAGVSLQDALRMAGYSALPSRLIDPGRHAAYLEPHIEQGPWLEAGGKRLGVVTAIVGAREFHVSFTGQQNHAGTAPMPLRSDAAMAAYHFAADLDTRYQAIAANDIVWTFGRIELTPNRPSIVPGGALITVQFRCSSADTLDLFEAEMRQIVDEIARQRPWSMPVIRPVLDFIPTQMNGKIQALLAKAAAAAAGDAWCHMPSGAGHDAQFLAPLIPTGMLFVPSIGGVSHAFDEDTAEADIVLGCEVMADALTDMLACDIF